MRSLDAPFYCFDRHFKSVWPVHEIIGFSPNNIQIGDHFLRIINLCFSKNYIFHIH